MRLRFAFVGFVALACSAQPPSHKVELVTAAAATDEATEIAAQVERAVHDGKRLVVYVGAPWCEPCEKFHRAAADGELDAAFPDTRFLVFDADRDTESLARAGYVSKLIPLFAIPRNDGRSSTRQIEGSIKGAAVDEITPRLKALLASP